MRLQTDVPKVIPQPSFYIYITLFMLLLPLKWLVAWFSAALIHELFHVAAIYLCKNRVLEVKLRASGAVIKTDGLNRRCEFVCAIAGPAGSLVALLLFRKMPVFALFAAVQLFVNLLPIYPLDGGRVFRCILLKFFAYHTTIKISRVMEIIFKIFLLLLGLWISAWQKAWIILAFTIVFCWRKRKIPCKQSF